MFFSIVLLFAVFMFGSYIQVRPSNINSVIVLTELTLLGRTMIKTIMNYFNNIINKNVEPRIHRNNERQKSFILKDSLGDDT